MTCSKCFLMNWLLKSGLRNDAGQMKEHVRIAALRAQKLGRAGSLRRITAKIVESISAFAVERLWRGQIIPAIMGDCHITYKKQI